MADVECKAWLTQLGLRPRATFGSLTRDAATATVDYANGAIAFFAVRGRPGSWSFEIEARNTHDDMLRLKEAAAPPASEVARWLTAAGVLR